MNGRVLTERSALEFARSLPRETLRVLVAIAVENEPRRAEAIADEWADQRGLSNVGRWMIADLTYYMAANYAAMVAVRCEQ